MTAGSAVPAVTDRLLALAAQAAATLDPAPLIVDTWPDTVSLFMFAVGTDAPPGPDTGLSSDVTDEFKGLGAQILEETIDTHCWIYAATGGADQKPVRDLVYAAWDAFVVLFRADLRLGGAASQWAEIVQHNLTGPKTADAAGEGRYALLSFTVRAINRY